MSEIKVHVEAESAEQAVDIAVVRIEQLNKLIAPLDAILEGDVEPKVVAYQLLAIGEAIYLWPQGINRTTARVALQRLALNMTMHLSAKETALIARNAIVAEYKEM